MFGSPLPLNISWMARDSANSNENMRLSSVTEGSVIMDSVIGDAIGSELRLLRNGIFTSPRCRITNGNGLIVDQQDFIGRYNTITNLYSILNHSVIDRHNY